MEAHCELVDPRRQSTAFAVLHTAYKTAKRLVKHYGNVRVFSAEACHRPAGTCVQVYNFFIYTHHTGHETEPKSAMYVKTNVGAVLCTISMLRKLVRRTSSVRLVYL